MRARQRTAAIVCSLLAAATLAACTTGGTPVASGTTDPSSSPAPAPGAVTGLKAAQASRWSADPSHWQVALAWKASPAAEQVDHYQVSRDGRTVARTLPTPKFTDTGVEPGVTYRYRVVAVNTAGTAGKPTTVVVKTNVPPITEARLDGKFTTKFTPTSSNLGQTRVIPTLVLFSAACAKGPCDVTYRRAGRSGSGKLHRSGGSYTGTVSAAFQILNCSGATINESLVFDLHVTAATTVRGQWTATAFAGTMTETAASAGCVTGLNHWTVAGKNLA